MRGRGMEEKQSKFRYLQIYQDIKDKIESGEYEQGRKMNTEKEYQKIYNASRDTVRKAFAKLENEEYIVRKAAVGTFVKYKKSDYTLTKLKSFTEQMTDRGIKPSSEFISIELGPVTNKHILQELEIDGNEKCYKITRIRKGNGTPMSYEIAYVPQKICPDMQKYLDDNSSLYNIYENVYHLKLGNGKVKLEAELPNATIQKYLKIGHDSPILKMECVTLLEDETPLYYVECFYIGERYFFSAILPR